MGRTCSGKSKKKGGLKYIEAEAEEGEKDEKDDNSDDDGDLEEKDHIAYAALAAVRDDDKKEDEAAAEKAMKCADKKLNILDKATVMVKSKAALRDLSNGGNGEYPAAIDMRIDKELFDRFNTCMVPSKWPGDGEKDTPHILRRHPQHVRGVACKDGEVHRTRGKQSIQGCGEGRRSSAVAQAQQARAQGRGHG